jgi:hypothetical protein
MKIIVSFWGSLHRRSAREKNFFNTCTCIRQKAEIAFREIRKNKHALKSGRLFKWLKRFDESTYYAGMPGVRPAITGSRGKTDRVSFLMMKMILAAATAVASGMLQQAKTVMQQRQQIHGRDK